MPLYNSFVFKYTLFAVITFLLSASFAFAQTRPSLNTDLQLGDNGSAVRDLQVFLNNNGFPLSGSGIGSSGQESE